jgi:2-keto-4-pentenoate hydratase/2-oxohepta-3-ene-1,7-dioic acid hydratase in catechol pathway
MRRVILVVLTIAFVAPARAQRGSAETISSKPDTPFKLATFEAGGKTRVGLVLGPRVLDIAAANAEVAKKSGLPVVAMPSDMRDLIENYGRVSPRLYRIANYYKDVKTDVLPFAFDVQKVSNKAPIKYPYNLLAAAANYRSHANEMFGRDDRTPTAVNQIDPDKVDPVMFAKSPRSCIIDPNEPFFIPPGRNIDWEGELAIIIGRQALNVPEAKAHDYVFGYSIMFDVSDRGGTGGRPLSSQFQGPNWFAGKSRDRGAPFGPFIVPKEFVEYPTKLRIVTKVNGVTKQDGNSKDLIWDEAHLVRYLSSILTLYPGDVISSGTPDGVGTARRPPEYLKPGDVVTIEIESIGTLTTPMRAMAVTATQ